MIYPYATSDRVTELRDDLLAERRRAADLEFRLDTANRRIEFQKRIIESRRARWVWEDLTTDLGGEGGGA